MKIQIEKQTNWGYEIPIGLDKSRTLWIAWLLTFADNIYAIWFKFFTRVYQSQPNATLKPKNLQWTALNWQLSFAVFCVVRCIKSRFIWCSAWFGNQCTLLWTEPRYATRPHGTQMVEWYDALLACTYIGIRNPLKRLKDGIVWAYKRLQWAVGLIETPQGTKNKHL